MADPRGENNPYGGYANKSTGAGGYNNPSGGKAPNQNNTSNNPAADRAAVAAAKETQRRNADMQAQIKAAEARSQMDEASARYEASQQASQQAAQLASIQAARDYSQKAATDTNFVTQAAGKTPYYTQIREAEAAEAAKPVNAFTGALNAVGDGVRDYIMSGPIGAITNAVGDVMGNIGTTYYGSQAPIGMRKNDPDHAKYMAGAPAWDQFTYAMTPEEKNKQLPHAFIDGNPTTQIQKDIAAQTNGRAPSYTIYNSDGSPNIAATVNATNSEQRASGNGVSAPLSGSTYGNGFNGFAGSGGFTRIGGGTPGNYFSAIPDGVFNSGGSPRLMGVQTSYGNSYNAADQWTAGGNATQAVRAAATTGES